ncbi:MAG: ribonuclease III [Lachnospiraceae bacterium]|jgi:ribonuclease-3 family protein|nr:ribonuclease III [Lachnospiraceae bacterium]
MEKGINHYILGKCGMEPKDSRSYSPLVLAYIGDGIYDLIIRTMVVGKGNAHVNTLHKKTSQLVKAHAQSEMIRVLFAELTEEEQAVYRRGRNAHSPTMAKNATMADYRRATGLEALMGYLYLEGRMDRLMELVLLGIDRMREEMKGEKKGKKKGSGKDRKGE